MYAQFVIDNELFKYPCNAISQTKAGGECILFTLEHSDGEKTRVLIERGSGSEYYLFKNDGTPLESFIYAPTGVEFEIFNT